MKEKSLRCVIKIDSLFALRHSREQTARVVESFSFCCIEEKWKKIRSLSSVWAMEASRVHRGKIDQKHSLEYRSMFVIVVSCVFHKLSVVCCVHVTSVGTRRHRPSTSSAQISLSTLARSPSCALISHVFFNFRFTKQRKNSSLWHPLCGWHYRCCLTSLLHTHHICESCRESIHVVKKEKMKYISLSSLMSEWFEQLTAFWSKQADADENVVSKESKMKSIYLNLFLRF